MRPILNFVNKSPNPDPTYSDNDNSGFDLRAWIEENNGGIIMKPLERKLIHTGLYFELPIDCEFRTEIQVRPRSGMAIKKGLTVINTPGTIDEGYTGEICVLLVNLSNEDVVIENGDRIAQAVLCPVLNGNCTMLRKVEEINKVTKRGDGGFGHSGTK